MARWDVDSLVGQGPDFVRQFVNQRHDPDEFAPEFSWLLLAEVVGFEADFGAPANPTLAARWAEIAALLYEGLIRGSRPQDDLARSIWTRTAARYRALAAGTTPSPVHPPSDAREPHPL